MCIRVSKSDYEDHLVYVGKLLQSKGLQRAPKKEVACEEGVEQAKAITSRKNRKFSLVKWKKFKKDYNVTSATIQVLLEALGEDFFSSTKQTLNKN